LFVCLFVCLVSFSEPGSLGSDDPPTHDSILSHPPAPSYGVGGGVPFFSLSCSFPLSLFVSLLVSERLGLTEDTALEPPECPISSTECRKMRHS
jgi:hypothetical protein